MTTPELEAWLAKYVCGWTEVRLQKNVHIEDQYQGVDLSGKLRVVPQYCSREEDFAKLLACAEEQFGQLAFNNNLTLKQKCEAIYGMRKRK